MATKKGCFAFLRAAFYRERGLELGLCFCRLDFAVRCDCVDVTAAQADVFEFAI
jgi:hypothetical protein